MPLADTPIIHSRADSSSDFAAKPKVEIVQLSAGNNYYEGESSNGDEVIVYKASRI